MGKSIIREKASDFEEQMLLESGYGISIFKHLVITKQVYIDMLIPISIDKEILILEREE
uniref:TnsA endonuclease C-terminal domain-containing protein n=1 Tax=Clostridium butyricum TaxID=1492 RepID=UPI001FB178DA